MPHPFRCFLLLLSLLAARPAAAAPRPDSLRLLTRWPLVAQLRLARREVTPRTAPLVEELVRRPGLARAVRAELLANLAGHYLHENQPSLAIIQMLQTRQLALHDHDSLRQGTASQWLSYSYYLLKQPRTGLIYGREAYRLVPGRDPGQRKQLASICSILAGCAEILPAYPLAAYYYRRALQVAETDHDVDRMSVSCANLASVALKQHQYARAAALLDSANRIYPAPRRLNVQLLLGQLQGELAQRRGQYAAAVQVLEPTRRLARSDHHRFGEIEVLGQLVPALSRLGRYRAALGYQQRLTELRDSMFEESSARHAQELQTIYGTRQREQQLARQRQRIARLGLATQARETQLRQRTLIFGAVLVGAGLMLVLIVVRQRARHLLATAAEALRVRNRIAADLHDEVGTLLTRVNLQAELLRQAQPEPAPALDRLLSNSRAAAGTMRDIVWSIDAESDTIGALLDRMRDHLDQTATPAGLNTALTTPGLHDHDALPPEVRQHLYLVFKEAVTNAARHAAGATRVTVDLRRADGQLQLTVQDDGPAAPATTRSGMGLRNMRQRAAALRGHLDAGPAAGGFRVRLRVPL